MADKLSTLLAQFPRSTVASGLGATERTVRRWIAGSNSPSATALPRITRFLNQPENLKRLGRRKPVTVDELLSDETRAA